MILYTVYYGNIILSLYYYILLYIIIIYNYITIIENLFFENGEKVDFLKTD